MCFRNWQKPTRSHRPLQKESLQYNSKFWQVWRCGK